MNWLEAIDAMKNGKHCYCSERYHHRIHNGILQAWAPHTQEWIDAILTRQNQKEEWVLIPDNEQIINPNGAHL